MLSTLDTSAHAPGLRPAGALGLPPRQGEVLGALWAAPQPLTAAQITARLPPGPGIHHALRQLHAVGLITATRTGNRARRYKPALGRDDYLAALIATVLDQASDPAAVLRTALRTPPTRPRFPRSTP
jgi:predicted transcriptional regulator